MPQRFPKSTRTERKFSLIVATESENDGATTSAPGTRSTSELLNSADPSTTTSSSENGARNLYFNVTVIIVKYLVVECC